MTPDEELKQKRYRRLKRYINSLPEDQRTLKPEDHQKLIDQGFADANGLTPAGELHMHQLELLKWWANSPRAKEQRNAQTS